MKVWRLHSKGILESGPYRGVTGCLLGELIDHKTPWGHIDDLEEADRHGDAQDLRSAFYRATGERWLFGWDSEDKMRAYAGYSGAWACILSDFEVSVLEVRDFYVMPDGQVMFDATTAWDTHEPFLLYS